MDVTGHVQSTQNRKLVVFLQYLKKEILIIQLRLGRTKNFVF